MGGEDTSSLFSILVTHPRKSEISLEDPARIPLIVPKSSGGPLLRICKAAEGGTSRNPPPALRRAPRSGLGEFWRCCTEYRGTFSAPRSGLGEFWRCCTGYPGTFSATRAQSTNPATLPPCPRSCFCAFPCFVPHAAPRSGLGEFWRVPNILYRISWGVFGARSICFTCCAAGRG